MLRTACRLLDKEPGTKPLENLIVDLEHDKALPQVIARHCRVIKDFGNLAAHGIDDQEPEGTFVQLSDVEGDICARSLTVVAAWFCEKVAPQLEQLSSFSVIHGAQVSKKNMLEATEIDREVYPPHFWTEPQTLYDWYEINPDIFTMIVDLNADRTIGCLTALPLENEAYSLLEAGALIDLAIPLDAIRTYDLPDLYKLYVASVVVNPAYHNSDAFRLMYEAYLDKLLALSRRDIFFVEILADAVSADGLRLARFVGMKEVAKSAHGSRIHKVSLLPPSLRATTRSGRLLAEHYKIKYEEFKALGTLLGPS